MTRVLFVCLGNICRSPMARGIFEHVAERAGRDDLSFDAAGTAAHHVGEPPDRRALAALRRRGVDVEHRARQVAARDFERFDWILAMDGTNLQDLRARCPADHQRRLARVLDPIGGGDVADPYYGGAEGFDRVHDQLRAAADAWLARWPST